MAEIALVRGDTLKLALTDIKLSDGMDYVLIPDAKSAVVTIDVAWIEL